MVQETLENNNLPSTVPGVLRRLVTFLPHTWQGRVTRPIEFVHTLRWLLPLSLFTFATTYEVWEHVVVKENGVLDFNMEAEIFIFGLAGPFVVFLVLGYIERLLIALEAIMERLQNTNVELERRVAERTRELEERNRELARANEELKQVDRLKSDFIALVSHELLGPLTTVNGGLELLLADQETLPASARQRLSILSREVQRLSSLVKEILDISRLEAGKLKLNVGPIAVGPLITRVVATVASNRTVDVRIADGLPPVWGDETYIEEIVRNLVGNAVKHTPPETPIHVTARTVDEGVEIAVTDHGAGIPPEHQRYVFERFYRIQHGERRDAPGWGLGLYLTHRLVELHGGRIWIESPVWPAPEAPGTRVAFTLPITVEEPEDGREGEIVDHR